MMREVGSVRQLRVLRDWKSSVPHIMCWPPQSGSSLPVGGSGRAACKLITARLSGAKVPVLCLLPKDHLWAGFPGLASRYRHGGGLLPAHRSLGMWLGGRQCRGSGVYPGVQGSAQGLTDVRNCPSSSLSTHFSGSAHFRLGSQGPGAPGFPPAVIPVVSVPLCPWGAQTVRPTWVPASDFMFTPQIPGEGPFSPGKLLR